MIKTIKFLLNDLLVLIKSGRSRIKLNDDGTTDRFIPSWADAAFQKKLSEFELLVSKAFIKTDVYPLNINAENFVRRIHEKSDKYQKAFEINDLNALKKHIYKQGLPQYFQNTNGNKTDLADYVLHEGEYNLSDFLERYGGFRSCSPTKKLAR